MKQVVVIGGGFGGLTAARALRRAPVEVSLVDRNNFHLFQPLLYQVATAGLSPGDIATPIRWILRHQQNVRVHLASVLGIDLQARSVALPGATLSYDYLIIATGAGQTYFGHHQWQPNALPLKSLTDALEIRRRVLSAFERAEHEVDSVRRRQLLTFVIIGGGPTGAELAGALAEVARHSLARDFRAIRPGSARIVLVEAASEILPSFHPDLRRAAARSLGRLGVELLTRAPVTAVTATSVTAGARTIETATVIWAAGVAAAPLVRTLGVPLDQAGRAVIEPTLALPEHPEVFVIGDTAAFRQPDGSSLPGIAPVAIQMGAHAARNIRRALAGKDSESFRYHDQGTLATIGRAAAIADFGSIRLSGGVAWIAWLFIHLMKLVGFRNRLLVFVQWAWSYLTYQRSARLIIGGWPGGVRDGAEALPGRTRPRRLHEPGATTQDSRISRR